MLTRMRIVNIQKHKDLELLLDKINVIVGATDSGKTSVLRALTWALTNDDAGENLINNQGAKSCYVALDADGNTIERSWSKGKNAYSLNNKEFTTFRTSVPSPIADLLRLDTINIQRRRDLPFMVYFKASDCANQFSEMMDLSEIDNIITNSNKSGKVHADDVEQLKTKKAEIDKELAKYEQLDEAIEAFNALNKLRKSIKEAENKLNTLKTLQKQHSDATYEFSKVTNPANAYVAVDGLETLAKAIDRSKAMYSKLEALCSKWHNAEYDVRRFESVDSMVADFAKLYTAYTDIANKLSKLDNMSNIQAERKSINFNIASTLQVYSALSDEFKREFPKVCPLCGKENCNEDTLSC